MSIIFLLVIILFLRKKGVILMSEEKRLTNKDFRLIKSVLREYSHHILDLITALPDDAPEIDNLYEEFKEVELLLAKLF